MINLSSTLPANEARTNFYRILKEVGSKLRQITITHRGKNQAVIMSAEEFEGWEHTMEIISDKSMIKSIKKGLSEIRSGKGLSEKQAARILGW